MKPTTWIVCGALMAGMAVAAGAFGAHGLKPRLKAAYQLADEEVERRFEIYETAARYQMYHGMALILVGLAAVRASRWALAVAGWSFLTGTAIFSGCLYTMVLGAPPILGAVVPLGGVGFIVGWIALAVGAWRAHGDSCDGRHPRP